MASRLSKDILGIFGTRIVWTVLGVLSGVILARWLGPHDRGILALVLLVPSTTVTLAKLGISQSNVYYINREQADAGQVASNAVMFALLSGVAAAVVVWLMKDTLLRTVLRDVPTWALAISLVRVPMLLLDNYVYGVLQATGRFSVYNLRLLVSEGLRLIFVVLALIVLGWGLQAAVVIYTVLGAFNAVWLMLATKRRIPFTFSIYPRLLRGQLSFGIRSYVQTVVAHLLLRIDIYMVSYYLDPANTAFYALTLHFTELALEFPQAIGLVLYPRLASLPEEEVHRVTAQACRRTLMVTVPGAFLLGLLGPYIITAWYGEPYSPARAPLPWAAVGVVMMSVFVILTRDFTSRGRQRINIMAGLLALIGNVALNVVLIPKMGIVGAAMATAVSYTGACLVLLVFFSIESGISPLTTLVPQRDDFAYFRLTARQGIARALKTTGLGG
jgi:O-antigen/teichoic acid export membrane protein